MTNPTVHGLIGDRATADAPGEDALRSRDAILQAVALSAERVLTAPAWEDSVPEILAELGRAAGASRAYLFSTDAGTDVAVHRRPCHEWVAPGIEPRINAPEESGPGAGEADCDPWLELLGSGEAVRGPVDSFPEPVQCHLAAKDVRSILVVPVFVGRDRWGALGFDDCRAERTWHEAEVKALETAARIIGAAVRRERDEDALRDSEERYRRLVELSPEGILVHDGDRILYINPAGAKTLGADQPENLVGTPVLDIIHDDSLELFLRRRDQIRTGQVARLMQMKVVGVDGRVLEVEAAATTVTYRGREAIQSVMRDVTERKRAERNARELAREQAARAAAEAAKLRWRFLAEASATLDASLDYEATLRRVARLSVPFLADWCTVDLLDDDGELRRVEVAHTDPRLEALLPGTVRRDAPAPGSMSPLLRVLRTGRAELVPEVDEPWLESAARSPQHLDVLRRLGLRSIMVVPLIARGRTIGVINFASSSPDRRYGREELTLAEELARRAALAVENARLYRDAQQASQAKSDFLAVMSHELRTPLTAIISYGEMLQEGFTGPLTERQKEIAGTITRCGLDLLQLIEQILTYACTDTGRDEIRIATVELEGLVQDVASTIEPAADRKGVEMRTELPAEGIELDTDPAKLRQVLANLLSNAVKFTPAGAVGLAVETAEEDVRIRVWDQGVGIAPEHLDHIFEPFWQAEQSTTRNAGGAGIGLSIVERLTRSLGGDISVDSTVGVGTTFTLTLPRRAPQLS